MAMVWLAAMIVTASDFVIAGTTSGWYFVRDEEDGQEGYEMIQENFFALKAASLTTYVACWTGTSLPCALTNIIPVAST